MDKIILDTVADTVDCPFCCRRRSSDLRIMAAEVALPMVVLIVGCKGDVLECSRQKLWEKNEGGKGERGRIDVDLYLLIELCLDLRIFKKIPYQSVFKQS